MSYPNPREAPEEFSRLLNTFNLDIAVTAFLHSRNPPLPEPDGRLSEAKAQQWCDRMDTLLVSL
jgi:hypothetical protein